MAAAGTDMDVDAMEPTVQLSAKAKGKLAASSGEPSTLPWVEKYRPSSLDELISHKDIINTIVRFIDENRLPHLLFYGPAGTGKTSTILACAKRLFGPNYKSMILELNASDDRGIDVVREQIITFASTKKIFSTGFKLIILDEADSMTQAAQAALRRVMEKYTKNVRFCIICNYVSKIIPALQSRCTRFRFAPLELEQIDQRLDYIIDCENIHITKEGRQALLRLSKGDMRRALNILQSAHAAFDTLTEDNIYMCTGNPLPRDIEQIVTWMLEDDFTSAYEKITAFKAEKGLALQDILTEVFGFSHQLQFPRDTRIYLTESMADIENRLASGCSEKLQLSSLIGSFQIGKEMAGQ